MPTILETKNLSLQAGDKRLLQNCNWQIAAGEIWGVLGPNGVGKTTLLHTLAKLKPISVGEILLKQRPIAAHTNKEIARKIGVLFQDDNNCFPTTVLDTVLLGRQPYLKNWQRASSADFALANAALKTTDLEKFSERDITTLSGGEKQRLNLALLFTQNPEIYLLDEPTNHLDLKYQLRILHHLEELAHRQQKTVIMASHDLELMKKFCDKVLLFDENGSYILGNKLLLSNHDLIAKIYRLD